MFSSNNSQVSNAANYIEDVFSTYLYTGNGSTQTITNGIDLSTKGGLVWRKERSATGTWHSLIDTALGGSSQIYSNDTSGATTPGGPLTFNVNGFTIGGNDDRNLSGKTYAGWTFRKQPKFFDVVTYTGNGSSSRAIAHSLTSVPGCVIVKCTSSSNNWAVYHRSLGKDAAIYLNTTAAQTTGETGGWGSTDPTTTSFYVGSPWVAGSSHTNETGLTYVAYVFAHNAGGFGLTGTDNVISCGSFTSTGSVLSVNLGYEPQWLLYKESASTGDWKLIDNMRGFQADRSGATVQLNPNLSSAESALGLVGPTATGFTFDNGGSGVTYIYIAIRRGLMKVPTDGTKVFAPAYYASGLATGTKSTTNFPVDMQMVRYTPGVSSLNSLVADRLRGVSSTSGTAAGPYLLTSSTAAEVTNSSNGWDNTGFYRAPGFGVADPSVYHSFQRAPSFFDEVCYTGTGVARTVTHNLGVVPELMIVKCRETAGQDWMVYHKDVNGGVTPEQYYLSINQISKPTGPTATRWNNTAPTSSIFTVGSVVSVNDNNKGMVAYLFATCPGVSKVGGYTGNGSSLTINCGFAAGARFVLIKRLDVNGDWYVWDTARGIVSGNDPHLSLNTTAAEVTTDDTIDPDSSGFIVNQLAATNVNVNAATYIFLAIA